MFLTPPAPRLTQHDCLPAPGGGVSLETGFLQPPEFRKAARALLDFLPGTGECRLVQIRLDTLAPISPCLIAQASHLSQEHLLVAQVDVAIKSIESGAIHFVGQRVSE